MSTLEELLEECKMLRKEQKENAFASAMFFKSAKERNEKILVYMTEILVNIMQTQQEMLHALENM